MHHAEEKLSKSAQKFNGTRNRLPDFDARPGLSLTSTQLQLTQWKLRPTNKNPGSANKIRQKDR